VNSHYNQLLMDVSLLSQNDVHEDHIIKNLLNDIRTLLESRPFGLKCEIPVATHLVLYLSIGGKTHALT